MGCFLLMLLGLVSQRLAADGFYFKGVLNLWVVPNLHRLPIRNILNLHPWLTKSNPWQPWHLQLRQLFLKLLSALVQPLGTSKLDHGSFFWQKIWNIVGDWILSRFCCTLFQALQRFPFWLGGFGRSIYSVEPEQKRAPTFQTTKPNHNITTLRCWKFQHQLENLARKNWKSFAKYRWNV